MAKYDPLRDYLRAHPGRVTLSFDDVAEMVGGLPRSADNRTTVWWADDPTHVQSRAWLEAGRSVVALDPEARTVTFSGEGPVLVHFGVEVRVVELPPDLREAVRQAQARQYR